MKGWFPYLREGGLTPQDLRFSIAIGIEGEKNP